MSSSSPHLFLGLDLGQRQDHTALAVLHRYSEPQPGRDPITWQPRQRTRLLLTHLDRVPLGVPYLAIIERVKLLTRSLHPAPITLSVDASGVGAPVVELLRHARLGCRLLPVNITASGQSHRHPAYGDYVPRRDLLARLRLAFESDTLRIPCAIPHRDALIEELLTLSDRSSARHDDLALAVALAVHPALRSGLLHEHQEE